MGTGQQSGGSREKKHADFFLEFTIGSPEGESDDHAAAPPAHTAGGAVRREEAPHTVPPIRPLREPAKVESHITDSSGSAPEPAVEPSTPGPGSPTAPGPEGSRSEAAVRAADTTIVNIKNLFVSERRIARGMRGSRMASRRSGKAAAHELHDDDALISLLRTIVHELTASTPHYNSPDGASRGKLSEKLRNHLAAAQKRFHSILSDFTKSENAHQREEKREEPVHNRLLRARARVAQMESQIDTIGDPDLRNEFKEYLDHIVRLEGNITIRFTRQVEALHTEYATLHDAHTALGHEVGKAIRLYADLLTHSDPKKAPVYTDSFHGVLQISSDLLGKLEAIRPLLRSITDGEKALAKVLRDASVQERRAVREGKSTTKNVKAKIRAKRPKSVSSHPGTKKKLFGGRAGGSTDAPDSTRTADELIKRFHESEASLKGVVESLDLLRMHVEAIRESGSRKGKPERTGGAPDPIEFAEKYPVQKVERACERDLNALHERFTRIRNEESELIEHARHREERYARLIMEFEVIARTGDAAHAQRIITNIRSRANRVMNIATNLKDISEWFTTAESVLFTPSRSEVSAAARFVDRCHAIHRSYHQKGRTLAESAPLYKITADEHLVQIRRAHENWTMVGVSFKQIASEIRSLHAAFADDDAFVNRLSAEMHPKS
jgi:hypothetical protein